MRRWLCALLLALSDCRCENTPIDVGMLQRNDVHMRPPRLLVGERRLARTFAKLRAIENGEISRFCIVQLGASHTAALLFTDEVSERLFARFGGLGAGFVPTATMRPHFAQEALATERSRVELVREGDFLSSNALSLPARQVWGLASSRAVAAPGARLRVDMHSEIEASGRLQLFYLDSGVGTRIELLAGDATHVLPMSPRATGKVRIESYPFAQVPAQFELRINDASATLFGFSHERDGAGIVYDVLGLSGASVFLADRHDPEALVAQLRARSPSLYVLFYGTNESVMSYWTIADFRAHYLRLLRALRTAAPDAECLLLSNTDRQVQVGAAWEDAPQAVAIERAIASVAARAGCAFWSTRQAMGGRGGMSDWVKREPPLALEDRTHLTELGYRTLAAELVEDLFEAYERSAPTH